jgi:predicted TIM-barrel fold metal-dependent hydrolase
MTDTHIHIGQFEEVYYKPREILQILSDNGITESVYSSTTSGKEEVRYNEIRTEIEEALSGFPCDTYKPYLWYIPSYIDEGLQIEKTMFELPYKGIKIHPFANNWDFSQKKHIRCLHSLFSFAQDENLPILIHTGPNGVDAPNVFEAFFAKYKKVKIILAHCRPIEDAVKMIRKYSNVYGDTSFVSEEGMHILIKSGVGNKILTGTDFPITHFWTTHIQNKNISLISQYQDDVKTMERFNCLFKSYGDKNSFA